MTIVEFLEARLAEDERFAKEVAEEDEARQRAGRSQSWPLYNRGEPALGMHLNHEDEISVDHRRVLAEVEAKRAILADHPYWVGWLADRPRPTCERCYDGDDIHDEASAYPCLTLRAMATVYADHPDYQQEWAP